MSWVRLFSECEAGKDKALYARPVILPLRLLGSSVRGTSHGARTIIKGLTVLRPRKFGDHAPLSDEDTILWIDGQMYKKRSGHFSHSWGRAPDFAIIRPEGLVGLLAIACYRQRSYHVDTAYVLTSGLSRLLSAETLLEAERTGDYAPTGHPFSSSVLFLDYKLAPTHTLESVVGVHLGAKNKRWEEASCETESE